MKNKNGSDEQLIAVNKKASFNYFFEEKYEAGIVLEGWEIKSIREGKASIAESYVLIQKGEIFLIGAHITPLVMASTHQKNDPTRLRKLLLKKREIMKLIGKVERSGYTLVPLNLHFNKKGYVKLAIALARGKKNYDKRQAIKERDFNIERQRLLREKW